jgi:superfamily II DNA helicase RecQ
MNTSDSNIQPQVAVSMRRGRYFKVEYDNVSFTAATRLPLLEDLINTINQRLQDQNKPWQIKKWQASVAAELLEGRDVVVKSQTGSGKSMCYMALAIYKPEECVLVICPLLALMADQVRSASELGICAIQLCAETVEEDQSLISRVRNGEYSLVFVAAEFINPANEAWQELIREDKRGRTPNFAQNLSRLVIDEAHLVREW